MNKEFKRFKNLPQKMQSDVCFILLFNITGSECIDEAELMWSWLEEINPLIHVLNINGIHEKVELFGEFNSKLHNKITQYLTFVASEINTL